MKINNALQRTAPCVTAPASTTAFPPTMQVPRRTPRSLSLGSFGRKLKMRKATAKIVMLPLALGCVALFIFFLTSEAASESGFASVSKGMTEAQVRSLLGAPHGVRRFPEKLTYGYGGFLHLKWCTMEVYFDAGGRVTGKFHDH